MVPVILAQTNYKRLVGMRLDETDHCQRRKLGGDNQLSSEQCDRGNPALPFWRHRCSVEGAEDCFWQMSFGAGIKTNVDKLAQGILSMSKRRT